MKLETIKKLCCPFDKAALELTIIKQEINGNVIEGFFSCNDCKRIYPIVKGIPIMSPDEYREFKLEQPLLNEWALHLNGRTVENFRLVEPLVKTINNDLPVGGVNPPAYALLCQQAYCI